MLTEEDDVEIHALAARGWKVSQFAAATSRRARRRTKRSASEGLMCGSDDTSDHTIARGRRRRPLTVV